MQKFSPIVILLVMAACASPSVQYIGVEGIPVDVEQSRFTVFKDGDNVQVIRTSREVLPNKQEVFAKATIAIERATGCSVKPNSLTGDQAKVEAKVVC